MTEITIIGIGPKKRGVNRFPEAANADEALEAIRRMVAGEDEERGKPQPKAEPKKEKRRGDALLTARADLLEIRKALLDGNRISALRRTDWLLDCIEEEIAGG